MYCKSFIRFCLSSDLDPLHFDVDVDPDPEIRKLQKKIIIKVTETEKRRF